MIMPLADLLCRDGQVFNINLMITSFRTQGIRVNRNHGAHKILNSVSPLFVNWLTIVIWIGINDVLNIRDREEAITALFEIAEVLYDHEARQFIFFNVPPLQRLPQDRNAHRKIS
jgi:hypothetical protein